MYVYFIEVICRPAMVKIGISSDISSRMRCLQTGMPFALRFIGSIACSSPVDARKLERKLHRKFKKKHAHGEWFRLTPKTRELITSLVGDSTVMPTPKPRPKPRERETEPNLEPYVPKSLAQRLQEKHERVLARRAASK